MSVTKKSHHGISSPDRSIGCAILTVSDTRNRDTDYGGLSIKAILESNNHRIIDYMICQDEPELIEHHLKAGINNSDIQVILTTGGTGISKRDTTISVVESLIDTKLDGFGELFRMLSWQQVGAVAMLSRATAGLVTGKNKDAHRDISVVSTTDKLDGVLGVTTKQDLTPNTDTFIFSIPGSVNAVVTAMNSLIVPVLNHIVNEREK